MILHPAKYTVFWPGETIHVCDRHLQDMENISRAMGMPIPDKREEDGNECENCKNENSKKVKE